MIENSILLQKIMKLCGFYPVGCINLKGKVLFTTIIILNIQLLVTLIKNWNSFSLRMLAVEDLNVTTSLLYMICEFTFQSGNIKKLLLLSDSGYFIYKTETSSTQMDDRIRIIEESEKKELRTVKNLVCFIGSIFILNCIPQTMRAVYLYFIESARIKDLPFPLELYQGFYPTDIYLYFFILAFQLVILMFLYMIGATVIGLSVVSVNNLITDYKVFIVGVKMLEKFGNESSDGNQTINDNEYELKDYLRSLVRHHQILSRKVQTLNDGIKLQVLYMNQAFCLQICLALFCMEKEDIVFKVKYAFFAFSVSLLLITYSEHGQEVQDEEENARMALFNCSWRDKPLWFKKTLYTMSIRSNKQQKISVLDILVLNRHNVKVVFKAAYSFLSLLNRFDSMKGSV